MAIQNITIGTPGAGGGDPAYTAFTKINQNFSNPQHAASRMVGAADGNVMEVGAFGLGANYLLENPRSSPSNQSGLFSFVDGLYPYGGPLAMGLVLCGADAGAGKNISTLLFKSTNDLLLYKETGTGTNIKAVLTNPNTNNTTTDSNGFIKAASPVVKLFADKIESNDEAQLQYISFEKLGVGDYLIKGSSGFAQEGWYIETPKDANGNVLFSVIYETLENGDISVKTYKKKFDFETVSIVADLDNPVDITEGRWIDLRLQELPQPESIAPPEFQPTGLAEAVATVMESYHDPEQ